MAQFWGKGRILHVSYLLNEFGDPNFFFFFDYVLIIKFTPGKFQPIFISRTITDYLHPPALTIDDNTTATAETNDWAEILSHIINCMNLEQFEEDEIRIFLVEKISTSLLTLFAKYHFSQLEMQTFYLIRKNM